MEITPGAIVEGTVRSIASFGAFVTLNDGKNGLVHISEVAHSYVSDIRQHLTEGQTVKVKILNTDDRGRLNLSIKQAEPRNPESGQQDLRPRRSRPAPVFQEPKAQEPDSFEEKLKQFMADSNSKISGVRQYEHRTRNRKR